MLTNSNAHKTANFLMKVVVWMVTKKLAAKD